MTKIIRSVSEWCLLRRETIKNETVGFVPTMGALHQGHQSLLKRCRQENEIAALSIFVNPTQFNRPDDLQCYPQTFEEDFALAEAENVDYLFYPSYAELYPDDYEYKVCLHETLSQQLSGEHRARPGHFEGVLTVVLKLLQLIQPHRVYLGEKDYQQYLLIKGMVAAFFLEVDVIACPTVRDHDGLPFSSRNRRLTSLARKKAASFSSLLKADLSVVEISQQLEALGFVVDYIEDVGDRRLGAVFLEDIRLIDNVEKN